MLVEADTPILVHTVYRQKTNEINTFTSIFKYIHSLEISTSAAKTKKL